MAELSVKFSGVPAQVPGSSLANRAVSSHDVTESRVAKPSR